MAEIGSFRTGIGGFNKTDVLNYIDELNARHGEEVENAHRELEEARAQLTDERQKLEETDLALKQNAEQLSEALQKCKQLEEQLAEMERLRREAAAGDALRQENRELREQLGGMALIGGFRRRGAGSRRRAAERLGKGTGGTHGGERRLS